MSNLSSTGSVGAYRGGRRGFKGDRDSGAPAVAPASYRLPTLSVDVEGRVTAITPTLTPTNTLSSNTIPSGVKVPGILAITNIFSTSTFATVAANRVTLLDPAVPIRIMLRVQSVAATAGPIKIEIRTNAGATLLWAGQSGAAGVPGQLFYHSETLANIPNVEVHAAAGAAFELGLISGGGNQNYLQVEPAI